MSVPLRTALRSFQTMRFGFVRHHTWVAECIYADTSAFSGTGFYLEAFALPLFIPTTNFYFDFGFRIGDRWDQVSEVLCKAVLKEEQRLHEVSKLGTLARCASNYKTNLYHAELRLCIGLLLDDADMFLGSRGTIDRWIETLSWETEVRARCEMLCQVVDTHGRDAGVGELEARCQVTRQIIR